ncbi:hypothetical protein MMC17_008638 [Xylographa soralifera]|nr:hypothetical protein [Xylographa soralifera]
MAPLSLSDVMGVRELIVTVVFMLLSTLCVFARIWARRLRKSGLAFDDWMTIVALLFTWSVNILSIVAVTNGGAGQGAEYVTDSELIVTGKLFAVYPVLWGFAVATVKVAILLLYLSVFRAVRAFKIATYFMMGVSIAYGAMVVIVGLTICHPISYQWNPIGEGYCGNKILFYVIISSIYVVIDTSIFLLPLPMLWSLQMPTSRKIGLTILFSVGLVACVTTIIRIFAVEGLDMNNIGYTSSFDWIWCVIELNISLIVACLPILQPVWSRLGEYLSHISSRRSQSHSWYSGSTRIRDKKAPLQVPRRPVEDQLYPLSGLDGITNVSVSHSEGDLESFKDYNDVSGLNQIEIKRGFGLSYDGTDRI